MPATRASVVNNAACSEQSPALRLDVLLVQAAENLGPIRRPVNGVLPAGFVNVTRVGARVTRGAVLHG